MSGKTTSRKAVPRKAVAPTPKIDRRVRRTRDALGDALIALMQEMPFRTITIQHVLDRAGIGRSTFYAHYRGKDDLLLSDMEDFLEGMSTVLQRRREASYRVAPVREFFAHVAEMRHLWTALIAADKTRDFFDLAQGYFARAIEKRLSELPQSRGIASAHRTAMSQAHAGALLSLMTWWLNQTNPEPPDEMDSLYHQMVWSGVAAQSAASITASGMNIRSYPASPRFTRP